MEYPVGVVFDQTMTVPGCFDVMPGRYGERGTGFFRRRVRAGGMVRLLIDGVGIEAKLYWDGKEIGVMPYAYMPEEFYFDAGENGDHELVVAVSNRFNQVFFPFYDFYGYGGIFGNVRIAEVPNDFIKKVYVKTLDYRTGAVEVKIQSSRYFRKPKEVVLTFDGTRVEKVMLSGKEASYQFTLTDFACWSPDAPNLHTLKAEMGDFELETEFGIRQIATDGPTILLNGKPIRFCGYNRHESHPQFGAATPPALIEADLLMMKKQGCNFVRGSHYPQREEMLKICDRIGLMVWEETLGWDVREPKVMYSPGFRRQQLDQAKRLVRMHFNHPSIIIWGYLNETASDTPRSRPLLKAIYDTYKSEDDSRLVTFASHKYEKDCCMDIVDVVAFNPYPGWGDANWERVSDIENVEPRMAALAAAAPADKPLMISETGGSAVYGFHDPFKARWSEEYLAELVAQECRTILGNPRWCGLVFWHFCDAKTYINGHVNCRPRGFNDKGHLDEYRRPKMAWFAVEQFFKQETLTKKEL